MPFFARMRVLDGLQQNVAQAARLEAQVAAWHGRRVAHNAGPLAFVGHKLQAGGRFGQGYRGGGPTRGQVLAVGHGTQPH